MESRIGYGQIIALIKKIVSESGGGGGTGGVSYEEFDAHVANTKLHLTTQDRDVLLKANQFKGYYATTSTIPKEGKEGDYILVGETNTFWIWDEESSAYINTVDIIPYDDSGIKKDIKDLKTQLEEQVVTPLTNSELEELLK